MSLAVNDDDGPTIQRPPSPPPHTTFAARGIHPPNFAMFKPRDQRYTSPHAMSHVAWSCDGKKLGAVGIDRATRIWNPDRPLDTRSATAFTGGHSDDPDYISFNPTHPDLFCTSSTRDRRIVFWDARQSRNVQNCPMKYAPVQTQYSPDGRSLLYVTAGHQLYFMKLGRETPEATKDTWRQVTDIDPVPASRASFNHAGDGIVASFYTANTIRLYEYPSLVGRESPAAHVGGCQALALDPRGLYVASGGLDSIVNLYDPYDWLPVRTVTVCDHVINDLSFSHDGEFLAIASAGSYIDIACVETGLPMHRVTALGPSPTVSWHPSRHVIAYCGQTPVREGSSAPVAVVSMFGLLE